MLTKTSINKTVIMNVLKACRQAQKTNSVAHVHNRKGHAILAVRKVKGLGLNGCTVGFEILDSTGKNWAVDLSKAVIRIGSKELGLPTICFIVDRTFANFQISR